MHSRFKDASVPSLLIHVAGTNSFLQVHIDWRTERDRSIDLELFLSRLHAGELQHVSC